MKLQLSFPTPACFRRQWPLPVCCAVSLICACLLEVFVFNFRFFEPFVRHAARGTVSAASFTDVDGGAVSSGTLIVTDPSSPVSFTFRPGVSTPVYCLRLNGGADADFGVTLAYTDDGHPVSQTSTALQTVSHTVSSSRTLLLRTDGAARSITVTLSNVSGGLTISSVTLNEPAFVFRWPRVVLLVLLFLAADVVRRNRLFSRRLSSAPFELTWPFLAMLWLFGTLIAFGLAVNGANLSFDSTLGDTSDCYKLLTQALAHGQLHYLQSPPAALAGLADPYNFDLRDQANISCLWDSAYYHGQYFCYFGIAPLLLLLPFRLLTGVYLPTELAVWLFLAAFLAVLLMLYRAVVEYWFPHIGLMPYLCGAVALLFGCNSLWIVSPANFYELAVVSGLLFLTLGFLLLLDAWRGRGHTLLRLFFGGLCLGLTVASRPNLLLYFPAALVLAGAVIARSKGRRAVLAAAFCAPVAGAAVLLMAYNAARFGSPFEFGQRYQLTVFDTGYNSIFHVGLGLTVLFHYLFQPLQLDQSFPFFHIAAQPISGTTGWYYLEQMAGMVNYPLLWALPAGAAVLRRSKERMGKWLGVLLAVGMLLVLWVDATMGGSVERYTLDSWPAAVLLSLCVCFAALAYFSEHGAGRPVEKLFCAICLLTACVSALSCFGGAFDYRSAGEPYQFFYLTRMFAFWQ